MSPIRARLSAVVILATMLASASALVLADRPAACAAHHHECAKAAQMRDCCCIEQRGPSDQATPASGKTQIPQPMADGAAVEASAVIALPLLLLPARALTTSPRSSPPDLITLFRSFLI